MSPAAPPRQRRDPVRAGPGVRGDWGGKAFVEPSGPGQRREGLREGRAAAAVSPGRAGSGDPGILGLLQAPGERCPPGAPRNSAVFSARALVTPQGSLFWEVHGL